MKRFVFVVAALFAGFTLVAQAQDYQGECTPNFDAYARQIVYLSIDGGESLYLGTASWLTPTRLVTIGHVADAAKLTKDTWSDGEINWGGIPYEPYQPYQQKEIAERTAKVRVRLLASFPPVDGEYIVVVEIDKPVGKPAKVLLPNLNNLLKQPQPGEPVFAVLFAGQGRFWPELRFASGNVFKQFFQQTSDEGDVKPLNPELLWLEMITRPEPRRGRAVANSGSSGAPIFNCEGVLVGVIADKVNRTDSFKEFPPAWGTPNVMGVRVNERIAIELSKLQNE